MGRYSNHWPMLQGTKATGTREIYKCTGCGGESHPRDGHNGRPSLHNCSPGCSCRTDWDPTRKDSQAGFNENFDRIFPNAPGAGM